MVAFRRTSEAWGASHLDAGGRQKEASDAPCRSGSRLIDDLASHVCREGFSSRLRGHGVPGLSPYRKSKIDARPHLAPDPSHTTLVCTIAHRGSVTARIGDVLEAGTSFSATPAAVIARSGATRQSMRRGNRPAPYGLLRLCSQ